MVLRFVPRSSAVAAAAVSADIALRIMISTGKQESMAYLLVLDPRYDTVDVTAGEVKEL